MPAEGAGVIAEPETPAQAAPVDASAVAESLQRLRARHAATDGGEVASYIPELSGMDPSLFGICLATVDGAVYEAGDTRAPFTIQSMSKPLTYGLALERLRGGAVRSRGGGEAGEQPADHRRGDRVRGSRRALDGRPVRPAARDLLALRGPSARDGRGGLPVG